MYVRRNLHQYSRNKDAHNYNPRNKNKIEVGKFIKILNKLLRCSR